MAGKLGFMKPLRSLTKTALGGLDSTTMNWQINQMIHCRCKH